MHYAIYRPYGIDTYSMGDSLHRFETRAERDAMVAGDKWDGNYRWLAITAKQARRWFPRAFAPAPFYRDLANVWRDGEWLGRPTGGNYRYMG